MDKRKFMGVAALGAAALPGMAQAQLAPKAQKGPTVLTLSLIHI